MNLEELALKVFDRQKTFKPEILLLSLKNANEGAIRDVLDSKMCAYYQWSTCLVEILKPKQVVELGGAMGVWDLCVLWNLPSDSKLYSITLAEHGLEFSYVVEKYPNFFPVIGDDLDLKNWPEDLDLSQTDLWFIDSLHTEKQLRAELNLYTPFFKKDSLILFDDIRMPELWSIWKELPYEKFDLTNPCHFTGFGIAKV